MAKVKFDIEVNGEGQLRSITADLGKADKATNTFKASTVALGNIYADVMGSITASVRDMATTFVKSGIDFNKQTENTISGLRALSIAIQDKNIPITERFTKAQKEATLALSELQKINANTPHNLSQTNEIYKAMYVSMKNVGASTGQIINLTEKISIAAGAAGIEFQSLLAGVDGLASGTVLANSDLGRFLSSLGLTNDELKNSKDVIGLLNEKLGDFSAIDTYETALSNLGNEWTKLAGKLTTDIFAGLKITFKELSGQMQNMSDRDIEDMKNAFTDMSILMVKGAGAIVQALGSTAHFLQGIVVLLENAYLQASNLFSWTEELQKQVEANRESYMAFGETLENIDTITNDLVGTIVDSIEASRGKTEATIDQNEAESILNETKENTTLLTRLATEAEEEATRIAKEKAKADRESARALRDKVSAYQAYDDAMYSAKDTTSEEDFMRDLGNRLARMGNNGTSQEELARLYEAEMEKHRKATEDVGEEVDNLRRDNNQNAEETRKLLSSSRPTGGASGGYGAGSAEGLHSTGFSGATAGGAYYGTGGGGSPAMSSSPSHFEGTLQTSSGRDLSRVGKSLTMNIGLFGQAVNNVTKSLYNMEEITAMKVESDDLIAKRDAEIYNRDKLLYRKYSEELQSVTSSIADLNKGMEDRNLERENLLQERASILEGQRIKALEKEQQARLDLISSLNETILTLNNISSGLATDWSASAREALFGGTDRSLGYEEAKANAEEAWKAFSADTSNGDLLSAYNKRMNELIGTLDDFSDWTKYNSSAEQEFAKIQAQRDIDAMQDAQLDTKEEVDKQLEELKKITEATQNTYDETKRLEDIKKESEYQTAQNARLEAIQRRSEAIEKENRDATEEIATLSKRANDLSEQIKSVQYTNKTLSQQIANSNNRIEAYEKEIRELSKNIADNQYVTAEATKSTTSGSTMPVVTPRPPSGGVTMNSYDSGGYTGNMSASSIAGVVHGREYVLNAQTTKDLGLNENNGGVMKEIRDLMYEQVKTSKKIQSIERQMLKNAIEVA